MVMRRHIFLPLVVVLIVGFTADKGAARLKVIGTTEEGVENFPGCHASLRIVAERSGSGNVDAMSLAKVSNFSRLKTFFQPTLFFRAQPNLAQPIKGRGPD